MTEFLDQSMSITYSYHIIGQHLKKNKTGEKFGEQEAADGGRPSCRRQEEAAN
jgi:hypothetical protein